MGKDSDRPFPPQPDLGRVRPLLVRHQRRERPRLGRWRQRAARALGLVDHPDQLGVESLVAHPPTLEELFLRHYGTGEGARR